MSINRALFWARFLFFRSKMQAVVNLQTALQHGLTEAEYGWILETLGRTPTIVELGIYSVMWSEHCSYKNSIKVLKTLPREGKALLVGAGEENAGLVDVGDGLAVAFKIESHNHPSAVEPYQGAATGVGGIQRDIFTMGARPIASLNSLRFGDPRKAKVRWLLDGVVRGIAGYGNAFGVPTVAGEVYFDPAYEGNPLVNAMSVGLVKVGQTASAIAKGEGNPVYIVGASTGRDGIHGATFASEEISEASESKRPSVQVGDPFTEKLLLEATLEAIKSGALVGIQDMGAAGITCSTCEMSAKGNSGMTLHIERVPVREAGMTPYEIMLSESQERMLLVVEKGREAEVEAIFEKWDLHVAHIGHVTDEPRVKIYWHGELVADVPPNHLSLGGGAPQYDRETQKPVYLAKTSAFQIQEVEDFAPEEAGDMLLKLLSAPNIASKRWVWQQYDHQVRTNTVSGPGPSDAAVVRIKGTNKALAVKTDCNGRYVYLNPRKGGQIAVAEAARNVVCAGGKPLAITNCLNYGNPYKPEVYWVFKESVGGMGDACRVLDTPVTGGNVSFYNENPESAVFPTPTIGMLGLIEDVHTQTTSPVLKNAGDVLMLISPEGWVHQENIDGSEYLAWVHQKTTGDAPYFELNEEKAIQNAVLHLIRKGVVQSAHDVSDGGLAVCLAEMVIFSDHHGADIVLDDIYIRHDALLFGEAQSRVVIAVPAARVEEVKKAAKFFGAQATHLGTVTGNSFRLMLNGEELFDFFSHELRESYENVLPALMKEAV